MADDRTVRTLRDAAEERARKGDVARDVLYVALCGDEPLAGTLAVELVPGEVVVIGRGRTLEAAPRPHDGEVWLGLPDARVSERHAVVDRQGDGLVFEDLGSLNGSFIAGEPVRKALVEDGGLVVVGRTVLWFRRRVRGALLGRAREIAGAPELATLSPEAWRAHDMLARAAASDLPVLLRGETGTGKEVAARALHGLSGRKGRFVALNCGALPEALIESELFGSRRGAFSGATQDRTGLIAAADQGTLLLDEVGELPPAAQVKLLRAIQEREVVPLGASHGAGVKVDFRLVSATHAPLEARVEQGLFRADLFARIRGLDVELPPLRLRRMDLGLLVRTLLVRAAGASARDFRFDRRCAEALIAHAYPLNVRELEQALKTLVVLSSSDHILRGEDLASTSVASATRPSPGPPGAPAPPARANPDALRADLLQQLASHQGNISAVARTMRRTRMQVHRWLKRWNIDPRTFRGEP